MDFLNRSQDKQPITLSQAGPGPSQFERPQLTLSNTAAAEPGKLTSADVRGEQVKTWMPYGEAASGFLWESQNLKLHSDSSVPYSSRLEFSRSKAASETDLSWQAPALASAKGTRVGSSKSGNHTLGPTPAVSTAATVSSLPHIPAAAILQSNRSGKSWNSFSSGIFGCNGQLSVGRSPMPSALDTKDYVPSTEVELLSSYTGKAKQCNSSVPKLTGLSSALAPSATTGKPATRTGRSSTRLRVLSSSGLNLGNSLSSSSGVRGRCFSPLPPAPSSSSLLCLAKEAPRQPLAPALKSILPAGATVTRLSKSDDSGVLYTEASGDASAFCNSRGVLKDCGSSSSAAGSYRAAYRGSPSFASGSMLRDSSHEDTGTPWIPSFEKQISRYAAAERTVGLDGDRISCIKTTNVPKEAVQQETLRCSDSSLGASEFRVTVGPRTERVNAFIGFLKELYFDQELIPAGSVVDCLATLASHTQGLPAPHGASLPWCCVAGHEIAPNERHPVCLKDRVVLRLLNTLMRAQVLSCAQVPQEPYSCLDKSKPCGGMSKKISVLVLSNCPLGKVRVSLQPFTEEALPAGSAGHSLIPLASCSSVALTVSAVETAVGHEGLGVAPAFSNAMFKVHLQYTSFLRWLWEELCARKRHVVPFDVCTSIIACQACSPCICADTECASMLPAPASLPAWLDSCNADLAILLLLSLTSRGSHYTLAAQLLDATSMLLDKCSAIGLAAWLRASAVMGISSLERPASFGRVLTAATIQLPKMPLGAVLADFLWGLTLCGIPSRGFFSQAALGIARNMHMFELEDLCFIACCYALQDKGFGGLTVDCQRWAYGGYLLPAEFFRRSFGLKAYCLLCSAKMADTGATPVLGCAGCEPGAAENRHDAFLLTEGNAKYEKASTVTGPWTSEELTRAIVDKCKIFRSHLSLKAIRLLDFTEKIVNHSLATADVPVANGSEISNMWNAVESRADNKPLQHMKGLHSTMGGGAQNAAQMRPGDFDGCGSFADLPCLETSAPFNEMADFSGENSAFHSLKGLQSSGESSGEASIVSRGGEKVSAKGKSPSLVCAMDSECNPPHRPAVFSGDTGPMWGDQYVPAPAVISALHHYGAEVHTENFPNITKTRQCARLFWQVCAFLDGCASFASRAIFGYFFILAALYAGSFFS